MGILRMAVVMVMIVFMMIVLVMTFRRADQFDFLRCVNTGLILENILHKFLQPRTGNQNRIRSLCCLDLTDIQGIVMQTADFLGYKPGHRQGGVLAKSGGKFVNRQCSGSQISRCSRCGASGENQ